MRSIYPIHTPRPRGCWPDICMEQPLEGAVEAPPWKWWVPLKGCGKHTKLMTIRWNYKPRIHGPRNQMQKQKWLKSVLFPVPQQGIYAFCFHKFRLCESRDPSFQRENASMRGHNRSLIKLQDIPYSQSLWVSAARRLAERRGVTKLSGIIDHQKEVGLPSDNEGRENFQYPGISQGIFLVFPDF